MENSINNSTDNRINNSIANRSGNGKDSERVAQGISKAAWGYFFLYFDVTINHVNLLPSFVGTLLFLFAIKHLEEEEKELSLLRTLAVLLTIWNVTEYFASWFAINLDESLYVVGIVVGMVNLYFQFQFVTNLASIAARYQKKDCNYDEKLLRYRTWQTILLTIAMICTYLSAWEMDLWTYISVVLIVFYLIMGICLMKVLFDLRRELL